MGSNLQYKGLEEVLKELRKSNHMVSEKSEIKEVQDDWKRLQGFMSGRK